MRAMRAVLMMAAVVIPAACTVSIEPFGPSGTYELRTANGQRVPAVVFSRTGADGYTVTLLGGEVRLRGDNTFRMDLDYVDVDARTETRYTQGVNGDWSTDRDGTIWLDFVDPDTGDWTSLAAFRSSDNLEITIPGATVGSTVRTTFQRF
jgi:hypothetical protein